MQAEIPLFPCLPLKRNPRNTYSLHELNMQQNNLILTNTGSTKGTLQRICMNMNVSEKRQNLNYLFGTLSKDHLIFFLQAPYTLSLLLINIVATSLLLMKHTMWEAAPTIHLQNKSSHVTFTERTDYLEFEIENESKNWRELNQNCNLETTLKMLN